MKLAPEPILKAANETVYWACVFCRNQTIKDGASTKMINDVMEAIHDIPQKVIHWNESDLDGLETIRIHLGCFDSSKWERSPNLLNYFNQKLQGGC